MSIEIRKREVKEQRRSEILDTAKLVFVTGSGDNSTLGEVARKARLSRSLIYFYFEDNEDLHNADTHRALQHLHHRLGVAARSENRGMNKILALDREYLDFARTKPVHFQAIAHLAVRDPSECGQGRNHDKCVIYGERIFLFVAANNYHSKRDRRQLHATGYTTSFCTCCCSLGICTWAYTDTGYP